MYQGWIDYSPETCKVDQAMCFSLASSCQVLLLPINYRTFSIGYTAGIQKRKLHFWESQIKYRQAVSSQSNTFSRVALLSQAVLCTFIVVLRMLLMGERSRITRSKGPLLLHVPAE